ncbi:Cobyrinic acid A,C-diamide synthase [Nitrospira japonica]|uniref:Cobyrinate a,c-diamide synthase n=1 Tax=Nitrospira japonica TaxID=1325564 RepID=A0A1W1I9P3_9BACT|nr:cobyrinate a,c-diamide synthase [Nitrospira japonica]SLM49705.1 Cobyrinic acid A,C-diamide synthase [Nitrospira japonica]
MIPRLVIAGTASHVGKTTVTVGLIRALRARGFRVAVFKCGPDYLDPTYHTRAAAVTCHNLDGWMMGREAVIDTFVRTSQDADISVIEGMMGLFDGASPIHDEGSTAEIAKWLKAPVLLVCDASGMARSIAALARGFQTYDGALRVAGVIANRIGSRGHLKMLRAAMDGSLPIIGGLPDDGALAFPERHLGLKTAEEGAVPDRILEAWGKQAASWCDLDAIVALAQDAPPCESTERLGDSGPAPCCRIGLAFDEAFHFYYEDNLRRLERLGVKLVRFSPIHDDRLPDVDGLYFGGGYPEVFADTLSKNASMRKDIAVFASSGKPVYGECGGLMYLSNRIRTLDGRPHDMVGLIPGEAVMCDRLQALGYVDVETQDATPLGAAGLRFRGHQFRYSDFHLDSTVDRSYVLRPRYGGEVLREGYRIGNTLASYVHAHWASNPEAAQGLVRACLAHAGKT